MSSSVYTATLSLASPATLQASPSHTLFSTHRIAVAATSGAVHLANSMHPLYASDTGFVK